MSMDSFSRQQVTSPQPRPVTYYVEFLPKAALAPVLVMGKRGVKTIVRTGVGAYTLTMRETGPLLAGVKTGFCVNTPDGGRFVCTSANPLTGVFTFVYFNGANAATDLAANANNRLWVEISMLDATSET
jgi:hypothetical protein